MMLAHAYGLKKYARIYVSPYIVYVGKMETMAMDAHSEVKLLQHENLHPNKTFH